ncbi:Scr1 family TA system antitoxin-like transcriptional regulator [Streptosporangium sp. NPDC000396]|uniref:helix-turn-helix domain-containing protein n=1 Tax=Streptosporangium sp. NPDC000396 TaxID=3366185 RepID=UPI00369B1201
MGDSHTPQAIWGRELRHQRQAAGLTQARLAERIHFSESLVSGIETGQLPASPDFARAADDLLGTGGLLLRLLDWRKGQVFPSWFGTWHEKEQAAVSLRSYQPLVVPGLLQTGDYARALLGDDEPAVAARLERQAILTREDPPPPTLRCLIDEAVLHRPVGGKKVMHDQLEKLVSLADSAISIHVVPMSVVRFGLLAGFAIATSEGGTDVAHFETAIRGLTTGDRSEVAEAVHLFEAIRTEALPQSMSIDLIRRTVKERWT